ncbi:uncharacterized protein B0H18DRAFT_964431 [Fomitopsis serialis]|uniref:uncharacterized protein n=1 Tax=Fomitopsis serialis TaxID=139415 RepID=UPI002007A15C|nr:uncharacterized protein B0H18DRAFT_964431 [Neoantrodia serialis]KAH9907676.1 hypothetical protein B0H18DRAFT_964431 [Neoantrodia serialis]
MRACQAQPQEARRLALRDALEAAEKPPNFKGWLFPGAIKSAFGEYSLPPSLRGNGLERRVIVALVYVREATTPISLPLVVEVEAADNRQVFYGLCWWRDPSLRYRPQAFDMFNLELKTWERVPASTHRDNAIYLPLPLRHFPIFKPSSIVTAPHPEQFARGGRGFRAICSMKVKFIPHIKLLWPRGLKHPPLYVKAKWSLPATSRCTACSIVLSNSSIISRSPVCPHRKTIKHITVLCLEGEHFGILFDYCPTLVSYWLQPAMQQREALLDVLTELEDPPTLEGWLFPGAIKDFYHPLMIPELLKADDEGKEKELRVVEVLVFTEDECLPMSLPLISEVTGNVLTLKFCQPITAQVFPELPWDRERQRRKDDPPAKFEYYDLNSRSWVQALATTWKAGRIRIPLPLRQLPVFKRTDVLVTRKEAEDYSLGLLPLPPLCSMLANFSPHLEFLRPTDLKYPRTYSDAQWTIDKEQVATCPSVWDEDATAAGSETGEGGGESEGKNGDSLEE